MRFCKNEMPLSWYDAESGGGMGMSGGLYGHGISPLRGASGIGWVSGEPLRCVTFNPAVGDSLREGSLIGVWFACGGLLACGGRAGIGLGPWVGVSSETWVMHRGEARLA